MNDFTTVFIIYCPQLKEKIKHLVILIEHYFGVHSSLLYLHQWQCLHMPVDRVELANRKLALAKTKYSFSDLSPQPGLLCKLHSREAADSLQPFFRSVAVNT